MKNESGSAMIETAVCITVVLAVALGAVWTGNVMLRYYQLEKAVQAATRYGARSETIPGGGASRRRTTAEITAFLQNAAQNGRPAIDVSKLTVTVQCGATPSVIGTCTNPENQPSGTYLQVKAALVVAADDPVMAFARSVNGVLGALHIGAPFPSTVTVTDTSLAIVE